MWWKKNLLSDQMFYNKRIIIFYRIKLEQWPCFQFNFATYALREMQAQETHRLKNQKDKTTTKWCNSFWLQHRYSSHLYKPQPADNKQWKTLITARAHYLFISSSWIKFLRFCTKILNSHTTSKHVQARRPNAR